MSNVTNYVLMLPTLDDEEAADLQKQLDAPLPSGTEFVRVDGLTIGSKCMEATVFIAAANYFNLPQMAEALLGIDWSTTWFDGDDVRLAAMAQDYSAFEMYDMAKLRALLDDQNGRAGR